MKAVEVKVSRKQYTTVTISVPDEWRWNQVQNVLDDDETMAAISAAIEEGEWRATRVVVPYAIVMGGNKPAVIEFKFTGGFNRVE